MGAPWTLAAYAVEVRRIAPHTGDGFDELDGDDEDDQWPFQEPKLEVPTIYKAYVRPM